MSTKTEKFPEHSPLGASSAERWMNCPGSNVLLNALDLPESDESEYAAEGTNAHEAAAHALRKGMDAWELIGTFKGEKREFEINVEMADAIQMYLDEVRAVRAEISPIYSLVENRIAGDFNTKFYGTVDSGEIGEEIIDITDFKYGAGIAIDATNNPQLKYYAVGLLNKFMGGDRIRLRIVQPRAYHSDGPIRVWETTREELVTWRDETLIPAMRRAELDTTLTPGDWCRFCPAKIACPLLTALFGASTTADATVLPNYSDDQLARNYALVPAVKHYIKALEAAVLNRLNAGKAVPGFKLVPKKADRVFTEQGILRLTGLDVDPETGAPIPPPLALDDIYTAPEIKSPAQIAKLGTKAKKFVAEFAYTPQTGLTVAPETDSRVGVRAKNPAEMFSGFVEKESDQ